MADVKTGAAKAAPAPKAAAPKAAAPKAVAHHAMALRRGAPDETYSIVDARGVTTSIQADSAGVVLPRSPEDVRVADANALPYWSDPVEPEPAAVPVPEPEAAPAAEES